MLLRLVIPAALIALAGCSSPDEVREKTGVTAQATSASAHATSAASSSAKGAARAEKEDNDLYSYEFSYPAQVGAYPELAARLSSDAAKAKAEMIAEAKQDQGERRGEDFPYNPHSYGAEWKVVADLPQYLSLSNDFYTYTGGAHGMYGLEGFVWDKANKRGFKSEEFFVSTGALKDAIGKPLCDALNKERVKKGQEPVTTDGKDQTWPSCPDLDEATVLVGSSNHKTFDRITVWYGPYVAGSYAEGAYELDFPMTKAMLDAVKPAYKAAFSARR
jgi:hypothetical protein